MGLLKGRIDRLITNPSLSSSMNLCVCHSLTRSLTDINVFFSFVSTAYLLTQFYIDTFYRFFEMLFHSISFFILFCLSFVVCQMRRSLRKFVHVQLSSLSKHVYNQCLMSNAYEDQCLIYSVPQKLPQFYTVIAFICIGKVA